jgi:hypothetical protein
VNACKLSPVLWKADGISEILIEFIAIEAVTNDYFSIFKYKERIYEQIADILP